MDHRVVGLALIHNPPVHSADVIFVHGLMGHRFRTWETKTGEFWLEWLGGRLPQTRVWTYGYNAYAASESQNVFHVFATQFLIEMSSHLSDQSNGTIEKPIVFVAHDSGGILVKKAMILASSSESGWNCIFRNTAGIVFLGTPHRGSHLPPGATSIFRHIPGSSQIFPILHVNSSTLAEIAEQFRNFWGSRPLFSFRETTRTLGIMIVRQENAIANCQTETVIDIPRCNHPELSKPDSTNCVLFTRIIDSLFSLLQRKSADAHSSTVGSYNPESLVKLPHALVRQNPIAGSIRDGGRMQPTTTRPKSNWAGESRGSSDKMSTSVSPADITAIARDVVQETCLNFPIIPKSISQRRDIFLAARTVKEMCDTESIATPIIDAEDPATPQFEHDVADLLLYSALIVEYAADFLAKYSPPWITSQSLSVLDELGKVKDMLNRIAPEDTVKVKIYKRMLLNALTSDLQIDSGAVTQFIDSSFQRHSVGSQKAEDFIKHNPNWDRCDPSDIANLTTFVEKNSVSLLALRSEHARTFLNILEQAARSDSIATPDEKWRYQTYLRRLSWRSGLHPSTFHLSDVKPTPFPMKRCEHCPQGKSLSGPVQSLEGGFGTVRHAEWKRPGGKVVKVAIKTLTCPDPATFCHEAAFWHYLDADKVVPFYGVTCIENKNTPESCLVSQWMGGGRICCYVDNKEDSIRFNLLRQVADGIKYLHDLNLVHCDIKPANILIDTTQESLPKALIMDFGFSNAARLTNVAYSTPCGYTPGYVGDSLSANFNHWDPSNDVYAFGVTCCQVAMVNRLRVITSIPNDIKTCVTVSKLPSVPEDSDGKSSKDPRQEIIQSLYQKFFPDKKPDSPFVHEVFRLAAFTCSTPPCNMDYVVNLFKTWVQIAQ